MTHKIGSRRLASVTGALEGHSDLLGSTGRPSRNSHDSHDSHDSHHSHDSHDSHEARDSHEAPMSNQSVASGSLISSSSTTLTAGAIAHTSTIPSPRTFNVVLTGFHNGSKISTEVAVREGERLPRLCVRDGIPIVVYDDDGIDDDDNKDETYTDARADEDEDDEEESWHDTDDESTDEREAMGIQVPLRPKPQVSGEEAPGVQGIEARN